MQTIDDIRFDENLYSEANHWILVLYQTEGVGLVISLPNVDLLTFMKFFDDMPNCRNYISTNQRKTFTLFAYSENIETWFKNNNVIPGQLDDIICNYNVIPDHLDDIIIFCRFPNEKEYWRGWTRRYTDKVKKIVTFDQLEREALMSGMKYIDDISPQFINNQNIYNSLRQNHENIRLALINSFQNAANAQ